MSDIVIKTIDELQTATALSTSDYLLLHTSSTATTKKITSNDLVKSIISDALYTATGPYFVGRSSGIGKFESLNPTAALSVLGLNSLGGSLTGSLPNPTIGSGAVSRSMLANSIKPPIGMVVQYAGTVAPTGWLVCDGSEVLKSGYADLYGVIGDNFSNTTPPSNSNYFRLPNLKGRVPIGYDSGDSDYNAISDGKFGGLRTASSHTHTLPSSTDGHTLTPSEIQHKHILGRFRKNSGGQESDDILFHYDNSTTYTYSVVTGRQLAGDNNNDVYYTFTSATGGAVFTFPVESQTGLFSATAHSHGVTGPSGSDGGHDNRPLFAVLNYIIFTGV